MEISLALPVTRNEVLMAKALAVLTNSIAFVLLTWAISAVAVQRYIQRRRSANRQSVAPKRSFVDSHVCVQIERELNN